MARIKLAHIAADIRGKVGGTVFSKGTYGAYIRTKVTPVNVRSNAQVAVRQSLTAISQAWKSLAAGEIIAWNNAVQNFKGTNIFGDVKVLTGFNLYGRLNRNLDQISQAQITAPPVPAAVPAFTTASLVADTTAGTLTLTYTPAIPANVSVIVKATPYQSAGKNFVKSEYRQVVVLLTANASPANLAAAYIARFGALPPIGTKVFVSVTPVLQDSGLPGTELTMSDIAV